MQLNTGLCHKRLERRSSAPELVDALLAQGYDPVAAGVLAARCGDDADTLATPALSCLDHPSDLPDIDIAARRIARAVTTGEVIGLVTDHDVDGVTSHAILIEALTRWFGMPRSRIRSYIGHRLKHGYGLSDPVADRILDDDPQPNVVITADCGSADEPRIARLASAGIDVVVTDHHELGKTQDDNGNWVAAPPPSALAVINPIREESVYPDTKICGAMVSWLTMCAARTTLINQGTLPQDTPSLAGLLDFAALGTVADCVSLGISQNNRAVVRYGLHLIGQGLRPCWRAARVFTNTTGTPGAQDLAFGIAPRINARGRLDDAFFGVSFLLAETDADAKEHARVLDEVNTQRKAIERELTEVAMIEAELAVERGEKGLAIWLAAGHPGVHGIVASRVLERFGRPVVCLSPHAQNPDQATGSARAPEGVNVSDVFSAVARAHPGMLTRFGGHAAAGGLTLLKNQVMAFQAAFAQQTQSLDDALLQPVTYSDGAIDPATIGPALLNTLDTLEPYGRGFDVPLFEAEFHVAKARPVGADKNHLQLALHDGHRLFKGIWFFALDDEHPQPVRAGEHVALAFTPQFNEFRGNREVQLMVRGRVVNGFSPA